MLKIGELARWHDLPKGDVMTLAGDRPRTIRLNVNSPGLARLYLVDKDGDIQRFLATADRLDVVQFFADGVVRIATPDADVAIYSAENEPTFSVIENAETFTKIANRAARNPDLEYLMHMQQVNLERRMAQLDRDMQAKLEHAYESGKREIVRSNAPGAAAEQSLVEQPGRDSNGSASGKADPKTGSEKAGSNSGEKPSVSAGGDGGSPVPEKPKA